MADNLLLMMKDIPVIRINFDEGLYEVINSLLVPYQIKGRLRSFIYDNNASNQYNFKQSRIADRANYETIISFLSMRVLPLDRENAKKILMLLKLEQSQSPVYRAKIAISCRAVTLQDNYWIKLEKDKITWKDVDIRQNKLSKIVAQVALHGTSLTLQGKVHTPELTLHGAYAKCWKREDGDLYLYKRGHNGSSESKIEVEVSNLLDKCNVNHLKYEKGYSNNEYCCKCKCMSTSDISILSGMDFTSYCNVMGLEPLKETMKIDAENMYKMFIVDYLISNSDRHGENWGLFYDCNTMKILGCHPLYDHNNAFDRETMKDNTGGMSPFYEGKSKKDVAIMALKHVDFHFIDTISREDFIVDSHYKSFMQRAKSLKLI